jgi:hypothetical protein
MEKDTDMSDEKIQAYREAVMRMLDEKIGRQGSDWDMYEQDDTYVHPVVQALEIEDSPEDKGAWVSVMIWVPEP